MLILLSSVKIQVFCIFGSQRDDLLVLYEGCEDYWAQRDLVLWFKLCGQQGPCILAETEQEGLYLANITSLHTQAFGEDNKRHFHSD